MEDHYCNNFNKNEGFVITKNKDSQECLVCTCSNEVDKSGYDLCNDCYTQRTNNEVVIDTNSGNCKTINCICLIDIVRFTSNFGAGEPFDLCRCCYREIKRNGCVHKMPHIPRIEFDPGGRKTGKYYVYILKDIKGNELYIGHTNDLKRRLEEHSGKKMKLAYFHTCADRTRARLDEAKYKGYKSQNIKLLHNLIEEFQFIINNYYI